MVNITQIEQASRLADEKTGLQRAVQALADGRPIDTLTISGVVIPTRDMQYPPQMAEALRGELEQRISALDGELTELGVDTTPTPPPEPAAAPTPSAGQAAPAQAPPPRQPPPRTAPRR